MEQIEFRIEYDDDAYNIVAEISSKLKQFGLKIEAVDEEFDGYQIFVISKIEE